MTGSATEQTMPIMATASRSSNRLLIISHDLVGANMAGPGIRYYQLARVLAQHVATTLAIPTRAGATSPTATSLEDVALVAYRRHDWASVEPLIAAADICLFASDIASDFPQLASVAAHLVVDGYDPLLAEWLALHAQIAIADQTGRWRQRMAELSQQFRVGDFYICASERQRDWWLGLLEAHWRINPATYGADPSLRRLIDVVPYGLHTQPQQAHPPVLKGIWPGIGPEDKVLLWGGGLWSWLDPLTAIRALAQVHQQRPDIKLVFPGTRHPNPQLLQMPTHVAAAKALADELHLTDQVVFFGDWVPYEAWGQVLRESDLALSLHFASVETRLAYRSRILEYISAGLPIIATRGDATSELVQTYGLGEVVDYGDVAATAAAILRLLDEPASTWQDTLARARTELGWTRAAAPLIAYCRAPWRAADRAPRDSQIFAPAPLEPTALNDELAQVRNERDRLRALVSAYEQGRFIRLTQWVDKQFRRIVAS